MAEYSSEELNAALLKTAPSAGRAVAAPNGANTETDALTAALLSGPPAPNGAGPTMQQGPLSAGDVASQAVSNFPASLAQLGKDVVAPFLQPVQTAESLYDLGRSLVQLAKPGEQGDEYIAKGVGAYFADRWGGLENVKRTAATDPAGFLSDVALVLGGGVGIALKTGGKVAQISGVAGKVPDRAARNLSMVGTGITKGLQTLDPVTAALKAGSAATGATLAAGLGASTGAGSRAIEVAFQSGRTGGEKASAFLSSLRGNTPVSDIVDSAKSALTTLKNERRAAYLQSMEKLGRNQTPMDFTDVNKSVEDMRTAGKHTLPSGRQVDVKGPGPEKTLKKIEDIIADFRGADNVEEVLTAKDFDAMKQAIGEVRDTINIADDPSSWALANTIYGSVRKTIVKQDKGYAKAMKDYEAATDMITDIETTFALKGQRRSIDTQVRKLSSIMRDNVDTSFGRRGELAETLAKAEGGNRLIEQAAGMTLAPKRSRGLANIGQSGLLLGALATGNLPALAAFPLTMPRVVGEAAQLAGRVSRSPGQVVRRVGQSAPASFQAGRAARLQEEERGAIERKMLTKALMSNQRLQN
jgi:hypothetical protein|tara:strand:+ start:1989 stop:3740 length:1752 start_codon:yes stop_codon:yes gene_type:complete